MHFTNVLPPRFEYSAIITAFVFACWFLFGTKNNIRARFVVLGLAFTLLADLFLVVLYTNQNDITLAKFGVLAFIFAQLSYIGFVHWGNTKTFKIDVVVRICATVVLCLVFAFGSENNTLLVVLVAVYIANLCTNLIFALVKFRTHHIFAVALVLFLLCDVFVGLMFLGHNFSTNWAWVFYIPSQTLIAISVLISSSSRATPRTRNRHLLPR